MFKLFSKTEIKIEAPCKGELKTLEYSSDEIFRTGVLGEGCFIVPKGNEIYAPIDGKIINLFPTNHAIGIETKEGIQILIHIGIDTVYLDGKYIKSDLKVGDRVHRGEVILEFYPDKIQESGYNSDVYLFIVEKKGYRIELLKKNIYVDEEEYIIRCIKEGN